MTFSKQQMKNVFIFAIVVLLFVGLIFLFIQTEAQKTVAPLVSQPTPVPTLPSVSAPSFRDVTPGSSTERQVVRALGTPLRWDTTRDTTALVYPSGLDKQPINVEIDERGVVKKIQEPIALSVRLSDISGGLGVAELELYGSYEYEGFRLFVYLSKGVAILANPQTQEVRERWYFSPMAKNAFMREIARGYITQYAPDKP